MSLTKLKKTCNFLQLGILAKKKKIILYNNTNKLDSLFKVLCIEGLLQTFTRVSSSYTVVYPRYDSSGKSLLTDIQFIPKSKQIHLVKSSVKYKYIKRLGEVFIFHNKKGFFSFNKNTKEGGRHVLTIK